MVKAGKESSDNQALHIIAALGEIRYESHDLEAQLRLQLMNSTEAANKIEELKKFDDTEIELGISRSLTNNLREELVGSFNAISLRDSEIMSLNNEVADLKRQISELKSDLSIAETIIF
ncbi:hypothetical protein F0562_022463 [Nyssa sinensis]|uniref:Uncharacterized protein n=1 Tax=Nyssa sinensis TaxID=561372 RepID=A0A5J5BRY2_9ASTE|nr:hypothetical protein F0562_022463 [Nyssa sinensis]